MINKEKNFFNNVFNIVMDVKGKTKDNRKARMWLNYVHEGTWSWFNNKNGKLAKLKASYTTTPKSAKCI